MHRSRCYNAPMSQHIDTPDEQDEASSRLALRIIFAAVAMMALAGGFLWLKFGPSMFVSLVNAAMNCF